jgi:AcrR family transcriptional regulator
MVATIVEAATRILGTRGWARFTTNEVAQVAGISVGSLYQYFPHKLALAEAIRQHHLDAVLGVLAASADAATRDDSVARLVDGVIAAHAVDPALHRVLLEDVPLVDRSIYAAFEEAYQCRYRAVVGGDAMAGHVLSAAVEGVVHAAARHGQLASPRLKAELGHLVRGYLRER